MCYSSCGGKQIDGLLLGIGYAGGHMGKENGANEIMYKLASQLLKRMQENGLITKEECEKIAALNRETFSPELGKVYV